MSDFKKAFDFIDKKVRDTHRKVNFEVYSAIVQATPVAKGVAKNNWFPSIGSPSGQVTKSTSSNSNASDEQINQGVEGYQRTFITNNLKYIRGLNEGRSKQAPANFVERHVNLVKRRFA